MADTKPLKQAAGRLQEFVAGDTVPLSNGGTGQTTQTAAMDALSPSTTKGDLLVDNGTSVVRKAVGTDGQVLTADSTVAEGVKWATAGGGATVTVVDITTQGYTGWTIPTGVEFIDFILVGGGGAGGSSNNTNGWGGGGGGGGGVVVGRRFPVTMFNGTLHVTVGAGGATDGTPGNSSFIEYDGSASGKYAAVAGGGGAGRGNATATAPTAATITWPGNIQMGAGGGGGGGNSGSAGGAGGGSAGGSGAGRGGGGGCYPNVGQTGASSGGGSRSALIGFGGGGGGSPPPNTQRVDGYGQGGISFYSATPAAAPAATAGGNGGDSYGRGGAGGAGNLIGGGSAANSGGGGGGAGYSPSAARLGGAGADGRCIITYIN